MKKQPTSLFDSLLLYTNNKNLKIMKRAYFLSLAFAAMLFFCSCSDDQGTEKITYQKANTYISSDPEKFEWGRGALECFYLITGFNKTDECLLTEETFVSLEVYSDNELKFIGEDLTADGSVHMTSSYRYLFDHEPWNPGNLNYEYDYYQYLPVAAASGEGTYEFALKFYQPQTGKYFITPVYRMKVWMRPDSTQVQTAISLVN